MDELQAVQMSARAARIAERWQIARTELQRAPGKDQDGHPTIGWGRRLFSFPLTDNDAAMLTKSHIDRCRTELSVMVNEVLFVNPKIGVARLAVVYSLAASLGTPRVVDWQPLWTALKCANYRQAMREVIHANLDELRGKTDRVLEHIGELCEVLVTGEPPELPA